MSQRILQPQFLKSSNPERSEIPRGGTTIRETNQILLLPTDLTACLRRGSTGSTRAHQPAHQPAQAPENLFGHYTIWDQIPPVFFHFSSLAE